MLDNPLMYAKVLQMHQKLQHVDSFIQEWSPTKVAEVAQVRLEELKKLEDEIRNSLIKQQLISDEIFKRTKEKEISFFKEKEELLLNLEEYKKQNQDLIKIHERYVPDIFKRLILAFLLQSVVFAAVLYFFK